MKRRPWRRQAESVRDLSRLASRCHRLISKARPRVRFRSLRREGSSTRQHRTAPCHTNGCSEPLLAGRARLVASFSGEQTGLLGPEEQQLRASAAAWTVGRRGHPGSASGRSFPARIPPVRLSVQLDHPHRGVDTLRIEGPSTALSSASVRAFADARRTYSHETFARKSNLPSITGSRYRQLPQATGCDAGGGAIAHPTTRSSRHRFSQFRQGGARHITRRTSDPQALRRHIASNHGSHSDHRPLAHGDALAHAGAAADVRTSINAT